MKMIVSDEETQQQTANSPESSSDALPSTSGTQSGSNSKGLTKVITDYIEHQKNEKMLAVERQKTMHNEKMENCGSLICVMKQLVQKK